MQPACHFDAASNRCVKHGRGSSDAACEYSRKTRRCRRRGVRRVAAGAGAGAGAGDDDSPLHALPKQALGGESASTIASSGAETASSGFGSIGSLKSAELREILGDLSVDGDGDGGAGSVSESKVAPPPPLPSDKKKRPPPVPQPAPPPVPPHLRDGDGDDDDHREEEKESDKVKDHAIPQPEVLETRTIAPNMSMRVIAAVLPGLGKVTLGVQQNAKFIGTLADAAVLEAMQMYPHARIQVWAQLEELGKRLGIFGGRPVSMAELTAAVSFGEVLLRDSFERTGPAPATSDKGSYGVVFPVCLKDRPEPGLHRPCASLSIPFTTKASVRIPVTLAMKLVLMPASMQHDLSRDSGFTRVSGRGEYVGHQNPWREMVVARFASRLLRAGITPHVPLLFFPTGITDLPVEYDPRTRGQRIVDDALERRIAPGLARTAAGIATFTEFSDLSFSTLLDKLAFLKPSDFLRGSHDLWYNAFMQLMQGLLALQMNLYANHNDAHPGNIMGSSTLDDYLYYAVPLSWDGVMHPKSDSPVAFYRAKTNGVLWKWIDFGFTTSDSLFGGDDTRIAHERAPEFFNPHAQRTGTQEGAVVAAELYDVGRLVGSILKDSEASKFERQDVLDKGVIPEKPRYGLLPPETTRFFYTVAKTAKDLSRDADPGILFRSGSAPAFAGSSRPASRHTKVDRRRYVRQTERKGRLLTLFHTVFAPSRMEGEPPKDAPVYDLRRIDSGPYDPFERRVLSEEL